MATTTGNRQRTERALRNLAKPSDKFWLRNYRGAVLYRGVRLDGSIVLPYLDGDCGVVVFDDGKYSITMRMYFPHKPDEQMSKSLWVRNGPYGDAQEIARYTGKMRPVVVMEDLPEDRLREVERFAAEVHQRMNGE